MIAVWAGVDAGADMMWVVEITLQIHENGGIRTATRYPAFPSLAEAERHYDRLLKVVDRPGVFNSEGRSIVFDACRLYEVPTDCPAKAASLTRLRHGILLADSDNPLFRIEVDWTEFLRAMPEDVTTRVSREAEGQPARIRA